LWTEVDSPEDASWVHLVVHLRRQNDLQLFDVGVDRHGVVGEVVVDVTGIALVDLGLLMQRGRNAPDHAAHELAASRPRIHDPPRRERAGKTRSAYFARSGVDAHLDKLGAEREQHDRMSGTRCEHQTFQILPGRRHGCRHGNLECNQGHPAAYRKPMERGA
jgi:hypothetical protein